MLELNKDYKVRVPDTTAYVHTSLDDLNSQELEQLELF